jgi:hypothetical protein
MGLARGGRSACLAFRRATARSDRDAEAAAWASWIVKESTTSPSAAMGSTAAGTGSAAQTPRHRAITRMRHPWLRSASMRGLSRIVRIARSVS